MAQRPTRNAERGRGGYRAVFRFAGDGVNFETEVTAKGYEQWFANVRAMHAVSVAFGIPYICLLQPILGVGAYAARVDE